MTKIIEIKYSGLIVYHYVFCNHNIGHGCMTAFYHANALPKSNCLIQKGKPEEN